MVDQVIPSRDLEDAIECVNTIRDEGAGVVRYIVCMPEDYLKLVRSGVDGDHDAQLVVRAWKIFRRSLTSQPRGSRVHCPLCPRSLKQRSCAFGLAVPYGVEDPENGMMFGLCEQCAPDRVTAEASAQRAMENIYPGMRPLGVPATAGHA